jgi:hypothetical protein
MHTVVGVDKSMNLFLDLFITDVSLVFLGEMLEFWVKNTIYGMFFSWMLSSWNISVLCSKSMDTFIDLLISDIGLLS